MVSDLELFARTKIFSKIVGLATASSVVTYIKLADGGVVKAMESGPKRRGGSCEADQASHWEVLGDCGSNWPLAHNANKRRRCGSRISHLKCRDSCPFEKIQKLRVLKALRHC